MKKLLLTLIFPFSFFVFPLHAQQAPQKFNYQAVARDVNGKTLSDSEVMLRIAIMSGNNLDRPVYAEEHTVTTNKLGLFNLAIGAGEVVEGEFSAIDWGSDSHYLSVEMDAEGYGNFQQMGTSQLLSVPYALYAERSGSGADGGSRNDPNDWTINGNAGTDDATNFIGTTDSQDLVLKADNAEVARFTTDSALQMTSGGRILFGAYNAVNMDGERNIHIGERAGEVSTGNQNAFIGYNAGQVNTTGEKNTFIGPTAGRVNTTGNQNAFIGGRAGFNNTSGSQNAFIGWQAGRDNTTGTQNTFIGKYAGLSNTTGSSNTYIGKDADGSPTLSNATAIGAGATVTQSNSVVLGNNANVGVGTSAPSAKLHLVGDLRLVDGTESHGYVLTSDDSGNASWMAASSLAVTSVFDTLGGVVIPGSAVDETSDDFVFGSTQLDYDSEFYHNNRFFFDKNLAAFRAGRANNTSWDESNRGYYSFATGSNTEASGNYSIAMGNGAVASEDHSIAMGNMATASVENAVAIGENVSATNYNSIAIGEYAISSADNAMALGHSVSASGENATALGHSTTASGVNSTAMGEATTASGKNSTSMGEGTKAKSFTETVLGSYNTNYTPAASTLWIETDRLFTIGNGSSSSNKSDAMVVLKNGNTGIGISSPSATLDVVGTLQYVDGYQADGYILTSDASGNASWQAASSSSISVFDTLGGVVIPGSAVDETSDDFVFGSTQLDDDGNSDHDNRFFFDKSIGAFRAGQVTGSTWNESNAGAISFASGHNTKASGYASTAMGSQTTASGDESTAMGYSTTASNTYSTAMGSNTTASGNTAIAMGYLAIASGNHSISIGSETTASGGWSTAIGDGATASGDDAIAIGSFVTASGNFSVAMGDATTASGNYSTVMGYGTKAKSAFETTIGSYNTDYTPNSTTDWDDDDRLFTIGKGSDSGHKSNAMVVLKSGNTGIGVNSPSATLDVVGTLQYVDGAQADGYVLTCDASGNANWTAASSLAVTTVFDTLGGVVIPGSAVDETSDDFVFGSTQLDDDGNGDHDRRFFFDKSKAAFRAGYVSNSFWDEDNLGKYSFATGYNTRANGEKSTAIGFSAKASGYSSIAIGTVIESPSAYEASFGCFSTTYTPNDDSLWNENDRLFTIGNGTDIFNPSDAMVVLKNGNVGIGTATPTNLLTVYSTTGGDDYGIKIANPRPVIILEDTDANTWKIEMNAKKLQFSEDGVGTAMSIDDVTGEVGIGTTTPGYKLEVNGTAAKPGGGSWTITSDRRLKQNINEYSDGLEALMRIRPVTYHYNEKSGHDTEPEYVGVIAQELQEIAPYMVGNFEKDGVEYLNVDNSAMTYMLINAVKEQQKIIEAQQNRIDVLQAENTDNAERLQRLEELMGILESALGGTVPNR